MEAEHLHLLQDRIREHAHLAAEHLVGDFAFAAYDPSRRQLIAARDAFGVKGLFYAEKDDHVFVTSHASLLEGGGYDSDYIAGFLLADATPTSRTIYSGVKSVPPGAVLIAAPGLGVRIARYWRPHPVAGAPRCLPEAAERFRERFTACVRARLADDGPTWAELSGGTDSSSIVVTAHRLARTGATLPLASTVTYVDLLGEGDERPFVDAVVAHVGGPHAVLWDEGPWHDDGEAPPVTDEPTPFYPYFARDRRRARTVVQAGARVLLSGHGADHYLSGSLVWLADLAGCGRIVQALQNCAAVAQARRTSVWRIARRHAIRPLLPAALRYYGTHKAHRLPGWITREFAAQHDMRGLLSFIRVGRQGMPTRFQDAIAVELAAVERIVRHKACTESVERRYPFLDRALVELALSVPRSCINRPGQDKVLLREAMRGDLPGVVRQRATKGGVDARILKSLIDERERIDALLRHPYLAEIGAVDPAWLRRAVDDARRGHVANTAFLLSTLALETWLAVRNGQWRVGHPVHGDRRPDAA